MRACAVWRRERREEGKVEREDKDKGERERACMRELEGGFGPRV